MAVKTVNKTPQRRVITVCGSTTFWLEMLEQAEAYSVSGWIVLFPFVNMHEDRWLEALKTMPVVCNGIKKDLDAMHEDKIMMSDAILVVNQENYIGESTAREITFAENNGVEVIYAHDYSDDDDSSIITNGPYVTSNDE